MTPDERPSEEDLQVTERVDLDGDVINRIVVPALVGLLLVAHFPSLNHTTWAPRLGLAAALAVVGLLAVPAVIRTRNRPAAIAGLVFLAAAVIAAMFAERPLLSLLPSYAEAASLVLVAVIVGAWSIGTTADPIARDRVQTVVLVGVAVNIVVGLFQATFDLRSLRLQSQYGIEGMLGNPVHLGALLAGATALTVDLVRRRGRWWLAAVATVGFALSLSGSRIGTVAALIAMAGVAVPMRRAGLLVLVAIVVGFGVGEVSTRVASLDASSTASKAAGTSGAQLDLRFDAWRAAVDSAVDRPIGVGPGRFVAASAPRTTLRLARMAPDTLYFDAHNLVFEYLATVGPIGAAAFVAFVVLALRGSSGTWLWFGVGILLVYLLQPQSFTTVPLAFLGLGLAARARSAPPPSAISLAGVVVAVLASTVLVAGDFWLRQADLDFRRDVGDSAATTLFAWPESSAKYGQILIFHGATGGRTPEKERILDGAEREFRNAIARDPQVPTYWNNLADLQLYRGELDEADRSFAHALEANPWSLRGLVGRASIAELRGDRDAADEFAARARRISPAAADRAIGERTNRGGS